MSLLMQHRPEAVRHGDPGRRSGVKCLSRRIRAGLSRRIRVRPRWLLLACLLLGADLLGWLQLQHLLDRRLAELLRQAHASGWQLEAAASRRGGLPFAATLTLAAPRLQGGRGLLPGLPDGLSWTAERVTVSLSPLHPRRITILPGGMQVISAAGGATVLGHSVRLWARRLRLELPASDDAAGGELRLVAGALSLVPPGAGSERVLTVGTLRGRLRWTGTARAATLALRELELPQGHGPGFSIPQAALELSLIGSGTARRLLLPQAALRWNGAVIGASGQLRLDAPVQPEGSFVVHLAGADRLLDGLAASRWISPPTLAAMRAVLGLIGQAQDARGGGAPAGPAPVELPLTVHAGLLSLGRIPLLQLPPVAAPDAVP